ncbi:aromatic acid exporter family protein [Microbacterium sp. ZXX196]|uniref:FUSC family protein n=1 Tax=Microbacterium sp. ZXX196 TaxID=2609291 RepID=UPI001329F3CE|nr:FUSC family protein [Microbacterium sp. ZXX196]MTE23440.1 FUSC family protein [Microbacterium sp. ZXX196]
MSEPDPLTQVTPARWHHGYRPRAGVARLRESWIAIAQIVVAASAGYALAHLVLGHDTPLLAATVTISSLGLLRDARPAKVAQTIAGMLTGIAISELALLAMGPGWWQLAIVLTITLIVGRFVSPSPQFPLAAAVQAAIAFILPVGDFAGLRLLDGAIGGATALIVTALLPRNPMRAIARDAHEVWGGLDHAMTRVVQGLRRGDRLRAERGLALARELQAPVTAWSVALESGRAISRVSPFLHTRRLELARLGRIQQAADLATRNLRVLARRAHYAVEDGAPREGLADLVGEVQAAAALVAGCVTDPGAESRAQEALRAIARRLDPAALVPRAQLGDQNVVTSLRPMVVDLLVAAGVDRSEAAHELPRI